VDCGIPGSDPAINDNRPGTGQPANRNGGTFADTTGAPFTFTCNGGCTGDISNVDLVKGKFTDHTDLAGTPTLLTGRGGFGEAGNFSHAGKGVVTLQVGKDGKKDVITSDGNGLGGDDWSTIIT